MHVPTLSIALSSSRRPHTSTHARARNRFPRRLSSPSPCVAYTRTKPPALSPVPSSSPTTACSRSVARALGQLGRMAPVALGGGAGDGEGEGWDSLGTERTVGEWRGEL